MLKRCVNWPGLIRGALAAGKPFRFACSEKRQFNEFCKIVWMVADGRRDTYVVAEECGGYLDNSCINCQTIGMN